jgi:methionine-rich copper-binding protein CopC
MRAARNILAVAACLLVTAGPAWGHGKEIKTDPKRNAVLGRPPAAVSLTLTEKPTENVSFEVLDGCKEDLVAHIALSGEKMTAHLSKGSPGDYQVRWKVVSAVDGHPTDGTFGFRVKGAPDCATDDKDNEADADDGSGNGAAGGNAAPPTVSNDDDSSFPIVPVGLGVAAVIAIALGARFAGSR